MVLAFEVVLRWPLVGLEGGRPWGAWREGSWGGMVEDEYVMVVWTLYGNCEWKCERDAVVDAKIGRA